MRVIAGKYRSRRLQTLRGMALRPSSDRLRETLFNILGPAVEGSIFLDLFAGSGAVGIEALSRGARAAILVENHPAGAALIYRNLQSLNIPTSEITKTVFAGTAEVLSMSVLDALERLHGRGVRADFVFVDPPYADIGAYEAVLAELGAAQLLAPGGRVIVEHRRKQELPALAGHLERTRILEQGDTSLSFYTPLSVA